MALIVDILIRICLLVIICLIQLRMYEALLLVGDVALPLLFVFHIDVDVANILL